MLWGHFQNQKLPTDFFEEAKILSSLLKIDAALSPAGARTEGRVMAEFFTEAISRNFDVVVICD